MKEPTVVGILAWVKGQCLTSRVDRNSKETSDALWFCVSAVRQDVFLFFRNSTQMMHAVCVALYQHLSCEIHFAVRTVNIANMLS